MLENNLAWPIYLASLLYELMTFTTLAHWNNKCITLAGPWLPNFSKPPRRTHMDGMILCDHLGAINFSSCRALYSCRDPLEAELHACMEGISLALQRSDLPVALELDSLEVVSLISSSDTDRSVYSSIVREIKYLLGLRKTCISNSE